MVPRQAQNNAGVEVGWCGEKLYWSKMGPLRVFRNHTHHFQGHWHHLACSAVCKHAPAGQPHMVAPYSRGYSAPNSVGGCSKAFASSRCKEAGPHAVQICMKNGLQA
jgi:hypothetical protein